jgi:hypothetical protein
MIYNLLSAEYSRRPLLLSDLKKSWHGLIFRPTVRVFLLLLVLPLFILGNDYVYVCLHSISISRIHGTLSRIQQKNPVSVALSTIRKTKNEKGSFGWQTHR